MHPFIRVILREVEFKEEKEVEGVGEEVKEAPKIEAEKKATEEELKELVKALKDTLVDLRAAISELTNPLNVMRRYGELEELEAVKKAATEHAVPPYSARVEESQVPQVKEVKELAELKESKRVEEELVHEGKHEKERVTAKVEQPPAEIKRELGEEGKAPPYVPEEVAVPTQISGRKTPREFSLIKLMKMFYMLREKLPSDLLRKYIDLMVSLGKVSKEESEVIRRILEIIDDSAWLGLSVDDQIVIMYILSKALGVRNDELEEELLGILTSKLRSVRSKMRGEEDWGSQQQ